MRRDANFQLRNIAVSVALTHVIGTRAFYNCQVPTRMVRINFKCLFFFALAVKSALV